VSLDGECARLGLETGLEITGTGRELRPGAAATSIVKQERIQLSREQPRGDNVFPCRIEAQTYLGGTINYLCRLRQETVTVAVPNNRAFERFDTGEAAFASWSKADCHIFVA